MKKKIVTLMLATVLTASALTACGSSSDSSASFSASASSASVEFSDSSTETTSSSVIADVSAISDSTATENISEESVSASSESSENSVAFTPIGDSLAIDFDLNGPLEFPDDATGKWREVHVLYNFSNKTVNCINCFGSFLDLRVLDYVDKEEHSAKAACGGTLLAEYHIDIATGVVEQIQ